MNNYIDKDSLTLFIEEIEMCMDRKNYLAALHMALSIPDMLSKLVYKNLGGKQRYIKWFDENTYDILFGHFLPNNTDKSVESFPELNGEVCYALRCKMFHEGTNEVSNKTKAEINEFVLVADNNVFVFGNYAGKDYEFDKWDPVTNKAPEINYLYVSCKGLTKEIIEAAKAFRKNNPDLDYPTIRMNNGGGKINRDFFK